jgi:hypothetical protein
MALRVDRKPVRPAPALLEAGEAPRLAGLPVREVVRADEAAAGVTV